MADPRSGRVEAPFGRLSDHVQSAIRAQILTGDLAPGSRLVELELARSLQVSQGPVRDALVQLAHEGLVVKVPRRGSFVATVDSSEAERVYALREVLESFAAQEFCRWGADAVITELEQLVAQMTAAADAGDLPGLVDADMAFHRLVYVSSGHPVLPRIWPMLESTMRAFTTLSNQLIFPSLRDIPLTHVPLVDALRSRDSARAGRLFAAHVHHVWDHINAPGPKPRGRTRDKT